MYDILIVMYNSLLFIIYILYSGIRLYHIPGIYTPSLTALSALSLSVHSTHLLTTVHDLIIELTLDLNNGRTFDFFWYRYYKLIQLLCGCTDCFVSQA